MRKWFIPEDNEGHPGLNQQTAAEDDPVHQPWRQLRRVGRLEGLVGSENGEEEGREGAVVSTASVKVTRHGKLFENWVEIEGEEEEHHFACDAMAGLINAR